MERGYIKIYRKILDSGIIQNPHAFQLFGYLLLTATYKPVSRDVRGEMIRLEPGQVLTGRKFLSEKLKTSEQCIRTAIKYLEKNGIITVKSTNRHSLISIINWHTYQTINNDTNQQNNQQPTSSQPAANQQLTTIKELKKDNNINKQENLNTEKEKKTTYLMEDNKIPPPDIFINLPLIDGNEFPISAEIIKTWQEIFPNVDIEHELREIKGWLIGKTNRLRSKNEINELLRRWFSDKQNGKKSRKFKKIIEHTADDIPSMEETIEKYTDNLALRDALHSWLSMRIKIGKAATGNALDLALKKLDKLTNFDSEKIEIVNQSILRNWTGLFPVKNDDQVNLFGKNNNMQGKANYYNPADRDFYVMEKNKEVAQRWLEREEKKQENKNGQNKE